mmetsp:Transcript_8464/g.27650  ORF Transcript_8464/g.27650 Transcript_8464/m.27650 type:complete len:86 (+) Transcript_8464:1430-1687(+)
MIRLLEEKYYGGTEGMLKAMARLRDLRCKFLVAGRLDKDAGRYFTLGDVEFPHAWVADMFHAIPEGDFRVDISSTELRARNKPAQ